MEELQLNVDVRRGYLGLGSNLGDALANLRRGRELLADNGVRVLASSSAYATEPQGEIPDQPDFLNACLRVETALSPPDLLLRCKAIELELGRDPHAPRHSPRPLDIDVLLLAGLERNSDAPLLPHPEILARRFVLVPLLELDRELRLPDGTRLSRAQAKLRGQRVELVQSDW